MQILLKQGHQLAQATKQTQTARNFYQHRFINQRYTRSKAQRNGADQAVGALQSRFAPSVRWFSL